MTFKVPLTASILVLSGCSGPDPADALQTIGYMVLGLESSDNMVKTSDDPLVYTTKASVTGEGMTVTVKRKDNCQYDFALIFSQKTDAGVQELPLPFSLDLTNATSLTRVPIEQGMGMSQVAAKIEGARMSCPAGPFGTQLCDRFQTTHAIQLLMPVDPNRQAKAFEHFKTDICKK